MYSLRYISLLLLLCLFLYAPILTAGFAADDYPQLIHQLFMHNTNNALLVFNRVIASQSGHNQLTGFFYRPFTFAIYIVLYSLSHANPFYFHLFQLLIYSSTIYLLFLLFKHYFSPKISLLLAGIFLIHPANNELAAYIAALSDTLSLFFGLLALNLILHWKLKMSNLKLGITILSCLLLSLLSKETGILFVALSLIYTLTKLPYNPKRTIRYLLPINIYLLIPLCIYFFLRASAANHPMFVYLANPQVTPHTNRFVYLPQILLAFFSEILTPTRRPIHPSFFHQNPTADLIPIVILIAITLTLFSLWLWLKKQKPVSSTRQLLTFYIWIVLGFILYLQIFPLETLFAERWLYITEIGLLGVIGVTLSHLHLHQNKWTILCLILCSLLLLLYTAETIHLNFLWRDWQHHLV